MSTMHKGKCSSINVLILESSPQSLTMTLLKLPLWQQLSPLETCLLIKLLKHSSEFPTHRANEQNVPVGQKPLINHCFQPLGLWYFVTAAIANYTKVYDNHLGIPFFKSLLSKGTDFVWGTGLLKATFISKLSNLAVLFLCLTKTYFTFLMKSWHKAMIKQAHRLKYLHHHYWYYCVYVCCVGAGELSIYVTMPTFFSPLNINVWLCGIPLQKRKLADSIILPLLPTCALSIIWSLRG